MAKPATASISKLSTPEFTVIYADHSYDIPASTTIDPYTGKTEQVPAQHVENRTLQFIIKNPTVTSSGYLYYVIRMKGHFSDNWSNISKVPAEQDSALTVLLYTSSGDGRFYHHGESFPGPSAGQADFQVQAQTWGEVMAERTATNPFGGSVTTLFGASDWSNTQTIAINSNAPTTTPNTSPSQNPIVTPSPSGSDDAFLFGLDWKSIAIVLGVLVVALLAVVVIMFLRKRSPK